MPNSARQPAGTLPNPIANKTESKRKRRAPFARRPRPRQQSPRRLWPAQISAPEPPSPLRDHGKICQMIREV
jgi:hypothetical protein